MVNTFTLGPVLVKDNKVQDITSRKFAAEYRRQRVCIVQVSSLQYAIVACGGDVSDSEGMTVEEFAKFVHSQFPTCRLAYNLDGGGSANVIVHNRRINSNHDARTISDILYFASAYSK